MSTEYSGANTNMMPPARARLYSESRAVAFGSTDRMDTPCVETTWPRDRKGYGFRSIKDADGRYRTTRAHRWAWSQEHGPVPLGLVVMHKCDNPPCVNVDHLAVGTHADNIRDRDQKGRTATGDRNGSRLHPERRPRGDVMRHPQRGERNGRAKLTTDDVTRIRERARSGVTGAAMATEYGLSPTTVQRIINGRNWANV